MMKVQAGALIFATGAYCLLVGLMTSCTIAWSGVASLLAPSQEAVMFWSIAASPIAVPIYGVRQLRAIGRGERPPL